VSKKKEDVAAPNDALGMAKIQAAIDVLVAQRDHAQSKWAEAAGEIAALRLQLDEALKKLAKRAAKSAGTV
jgi:hypothetical protein